MLRLVLDSHSQISCGPETRFLADLRADRRAGTGNGWPAFGFTQEEWLRADRRLLRRHARATTRAAAGKARWADKTPMYALSMDFVTRGVPGRAVRAPDPRRPGRGGVAPQAVRLLVRGQVRGEVAALHPGRAGAGAALPAGRYHELRYEEAVADPDNALRALFEFLGEEWEDGVLDYADRPHDVAGKYTVEAGQAPRRRGHRRRRSTLPGRHLPAGAGPVPAASWCGSSPGRC